MIPYLIFAVVAQFTIYVHAGFTGVALAKALETEDDSCG